MGAIGIVPRATFASPRRLALSTIACVTATRVTFADPESPAAADPPVEVPGAEAGPEVIEVTGEAVHAEPTVASYHRDEVRRLPGAMGDGFRAIETLPGVTPAISGFPFYFVRGAPPGNVGYFVDGIRVPSVYHIAFGPSVLQPALVERVDLYAGSYPARFGRFAGAIVSAETTEPQPVLRSEGSLRLFDAGGLVESGFANGRGTILAGGRYSYTAALLSQLADDVQADYRDFVVRATYKPTANDRLTILGLGAYDYFGKKRGDEVSVIYGSEFYRADVRWNRRFRGDSVLEAAVTLGYDRSHLGVIAGSDRFASDRSIAARAAGATPLGDGIVLRYGVDGAIDRYAVGAAMFVDPDDPVVQSFERNFPARTDRVAGAWSDLVIRATRRLSITPGLRGDVYRSGDASRRAIEPRLAARFAATPWLSVLPAAGIAHQPPSYSIALAALAPSLAKGLQTSYQSSLGFEVSPDHASRLTVTGFYHRFENMTDRLGAPGLELSPKLPDLLAAGDEPGTPGRALGGEVLARRRWSSRVDALVSYTLSRSTREVDGVERPSSVDHTHVLNVAISVDVGGGFRAGARGFFESGAPDGDRRRSPFYRADLKLERRWSWTTHYLSLVAEVLNATGQADRGDALVVIPSLGLEGAY